MLALLTIKRVIILLASNSCRLQQILYINMLIDIDLLLCLPFGILLKTPSMTLKFSRSTRPCPLTLCLLMNVGLRFSRSYFSISLHIGLLAMVVASPRFWSPCRSLIHFIQTVFDSTSILTALRLSLTLNFSLSISLLEGYRILNRLRTGSIINCLNLIPNCQCLRWAHNGQLFLDALRVLVHFFGVDRVAF